MICFNVPAVPVAQPRQKQAVIAGRVHNYMPTLHPVNAFKATVRQVAAEHFAAPLDEALSVTLVFVLPRPRSLVWKVKPMPRRPHAGSRNDADNLAKSVLDALTGLAWRDDGQVAVLHIEKWIAAGNEAPHVEIQVLNGELVQ